MNFLQFFSLKLFKGTLYQTLFDKVKDSWCTRKMLISRFEPPFMRLREIYARHWKAPGRLFINDTVTVSVDVFSTGGSFFYQNLGKKVSK